MADWKLLNLSSCTFLRHLVITESEGKYKGRIPAISMVLADLIDTIHHPSLENLTIIVLVGSNSTQRVEDNILGNCWEPLRDALHQCNKLRHLSFQFKDPDKLRSTSFDTSEFQAIVRHELKHWKGIIQVDKPIFRSSWLYR